MAGESDDIFCVSNFRFKNDQVIYLFNSFSYSTVFFWKNRVIDLNFRLPYYPTVAPRRRGGEGKGRGKGGGGRQLSDFRLKPNVTYG